MYYISSKVIIGVQIPSILSTNSVHILVKNCLVKKHHWL